MADNKKPHDFEEEFDFDPDADDMDNVLEGESKIKKAGNPFLSSDSNQTKFTLPILIGLAVAIFIGWKLYGVLFPANPDAQLDKIAAEESAAISASKKVTIPGQPPTVPVNPAQVQTPPAPAQMPAAPAQALPMALPPETAPTATNIEEIKQLENTINQVMDSLNKMDQKISLIGREFFAVADNVTRLSQEMAQLKAAKKSTPPPAPHKAAHKTNKTHHHHPKKSAVYHVDQPQDEDLLEEPSTAHTPKATRTQRKAEFTIHAIIPGRAWLRAPDGSTLTVTQGDTIPGYGKAMVIDAPSVSVVTSSGVVLR